MAKKRKLESELNPLETDSAATDSATDSESDEEDLAKTLEPFNKEQLIDLLRSAASSDPSIAEEIHRVADRDPAHRKLFVHGLGWETTSDKLSSYFSKYGELEDCNVVVDKASGKSKGYGFLLYKHRRSARKALRNPQKKIDGRMTACQLASAGPVQPQQGLQPQQKEALARKIYVGNVNSDIPAAKLLTFFSKYGEIEEGPLGFDKQTGKSKGFALFIYKTVEGARKALEEPNKSFEGHQLYCQKATDSHKLRAASTAVPSSNNAPGPAGPSGYNASGSGANVGFGGPDMAASAALLGQGLLSGALPFGGQGVAQNQAALAVLAAAGQNPAAFGVSPAMLASLNPAALAAALNMGAAPQVAGSAVPQALQGFGMGNAGYQNSQGHQGANSFQGGHMGQGSVPRPHSGVGPMGGYASR
ncbi:UBP1-associated protein 2A-like [Magnolia sinica]|uniref:UBP1-associated protein 2A-like n=1 Tax=Magnolia sinica TaxID=86752 RepID=UPI00265AB6D3|nr:UBP1-associated protein 2A-like [Magnolia sinica]